MAKFSTKISRGSMLRKAQELFCLVPSKGTVEGPPKGKGRGRSVFSGGRVLPGELMPTPRARRRPRSGRGHKKPYD